MVGSVKQVLVVVGDEGCSRLVDDGEINEAGAIAVVVHERRLVTEETQRQIVEDEIGDETTSWVGSGGWVVPVAPSTARLVWITHTHTHTHKHMFLCTLSLTVT